jgi:hypothetical protein
MAGRGYLYNSSQGVVGTIIFVEITRTFIIVAEVVSITFTIIGLQLLDVRHREHILGVVRNQFPE